MWVWRGKGPHGLHLVSQRRHGAQARRPKAPMTPMTMTEADGGREDGERRDRRQTGSDAGASDRKGECTKENNPQGSKIRLRL